MVIPEGIIDQQIIPRAARILVGVSGGIDSVALLHILFHLRHELALEIIVAHYDHALRPYSSKDVRFVADMSKALGLTFTTERNRTKCPKGMSIEDFARKQRFDFLVRACKEFKASAVVLAHTQDDLAETVLMRILRGSGLAGLRAILPERKFNGVLFLRPLLGTKRIALEKLLIRLRAKHINDPTNTQDIFLRNKVRHSLIPLIARDFSPAIKEKLAELAFNSAIDYEMLEREMKKAWPTVVMTLPGTIRIRLAPWKKLHRSIRRMVLREAAGSILLRCGGVSLQSITMIENLASSKKARGVLRCEGGLKVSLDNKFITLS